MSDFNHMILFKQILHFIDSNFPSANFIRGQ